MRRYVNMFLTCTTMILIGLVTIDIVNHVIPAIRFETKMVEMSTTPLVHYTSHPKKTTGSDMKPNSTIDAKKYDDKDNKDDTYRPMKSKKLYIITPTYKRPEQIAELTRLSQTLMNVPNLLWIISEEATTPTESLIHFLNECPIEKIYMRVEMPTKYISMTKKPTGVANRVAGLDWIKKNVKEGVLYFADDDNSYDIRIFEDIRSTKNVSVFPVGLTGDYGVKSPVVKNGQVVGFYDGWHAGRLFAVDMAGFAVSVEYFLQYPQAKMPFRVGFEVDGFLRSIRIKPSYLEPKAINCTQIWVWHTKTETTEPIEKKEMSKRYSSTNVALLQEIVDNFQAPNPQNLEP